MYSSVEHQVNALISRLQTELENLQEGKISRSEVDILSRNVEKAWEILCRRKAERRNKERKLAA